MLEIKFNPHQSGRQQSVTYDTVKDHILQHIRKIYELGKEIATSLRDMKIINYNDKSRKPIRDISTARLKNKKV